MSDRLIVRPEGAYESDFQDLKYLTVLELATGKMLKNPQDRQNAEAEYLRREEAGESEDENDDDYKIDLAKNGYEVCDGVVAYPTKMLKKFIQSKQQGPIPKEWRETLEERVKKSQEEKAPTTPNKDKRPKNPTEKAEAIKKHTDREQETDFKNDRNYNAQWVHDEIVKLKNLEGKLDADSDDIYIATSEPLVTRILNGTKEKSLHFLKGRDSVAQWATRYDDYFTATDIIYGVRRQDKRHEWSIFSIDVTTGNKETIRKKLDESEDPEKAKNHYILKDDQSSETTRQPEYTPQPAWTRKINFCPSIGRTGRHVEKAAPHFVIGLSRESIGIILENVSFNENGIPEQIKQNKMIDFMIASEFLEQINIELQNCFDENRKDMLTDFRVAIKEKLTRLLEKENRPVSEFESEYERLISECKQQDESYAALIDYIRKIGERYKKQYTIKVEDDIKKRAKQNFKNDLRQLEKLRKIIANKKPTQKS